MNNQKYYDIQNLLEHKAEYNILLGERSNGKSYQVKKMCIYEAVTGYNYLEMLHKKKVEKTRNQFAYLRRWREEVKNRDVADYFSDIIPYLKEISDSRYNAFKSVQSRIFVYNSEDNEIESLEVGRAFALTGVTHYKSLSYPKIGNIIYEEFITNGGYLGHEVDSLYDLVSTIARRDKIAVYLIGNTISRICPYFGEWELSHIKEQKQGTIDLYKKETNQLDDRGKQIIITIAVEYCENSGKNSKMFFGQSSKMITSGVWEAKEHEHLFDDYTNFLKKYTIIYEYKEFVFKMQLLQHKETKDVLLFIYPYHGEIEYTNNRVITDKFQLSKFCTTYLTIVSKYDTIVLELIANNKICYSDNLTGTEFEQIKKEKGRY